MPQSLGLTHFFRVGVPDNSYVDEDGVTIYVAEDGATVYVQEA